MVLCSFLPTLCIFFSSLQKLFVSHPLWGAVSGDGADAPRQRGVECELVNVGGWAAVRAEFGYLSWLASPALKRVSLVSLICAAYVSAQHRGTAEGTCGHVPPNNSGR